MRSDSRILLIGGTGFVGQVLERELRVRGYRRVTVVSRQTGVDITKPQTLEEAISQADVVINLAGKIAFRQQDKTRLQKVNVEGPLNILKLCEQYGVERLIHVSSTAALGFGSGVKDERSQFDFTGHQDLVYSESKLLSNKNIDQSSVPTNILFPPLIIGPGDRFATGNMVRYTKGRKQVWAPPGSNSTVDVRDVATGIITVLEKGEPNENFIVANQHLTFVSMLTQIASILGQSTQVKPIPQWMLTLLVTVVRIVEHLTDKASVEQLKLGFQDRHHTSSKLRALGWSPQYSFSQSVQDWIRAQTQA